MATSMPNKVVLKSTTKISLNDRFSKIKPPTTQNIRTQMAVTAESSAKNRRLAQQMSNRPTVQAALKLKKRSMQTRLGVKGRLGGGAPVQQFKGQQSLRGQSPFRGQSRGQLRGRGRGRGRGFFPGRGVSRGFARGGLGRGQTLYKSQGIFRSPATRGRGVSSPVTRGRGVGRGRGRGRGGRGGRGRGGSRAPASKGDLDNELDAYMSKTKGALDADLDAYMADQS